MEIVTLTYENVLAEVHIQRTLDVSPFAVVCGFDIGLFVFAMFPATVDVGADVIFDDWVVSGTVDTLIVDDLVVVLDGDAGVGDVGCFELVLIGHWVVGLSIDGLTVVVFVAMTAILSVEVVCAVVAAIFSVALYNFSDIVQIDEMEIDKNNKQNNFECAIF